MSSPLRRRDFQSIHPHPPSLLKEGMKSVKKWLMGDLFLNQWGELEVVIQKF